MNILNGLLLGLSTGVFCLAACAPVYVPQLLAQEDKRRGWGVFFEFNLGRLIAYIIFGAVFGWLGSTVHARFLETAAKWIIIALSLLLILYGLGLSLPKLKWCAWTAKARMPLISGFLLGINICPPFLLALTKNFQAGGAIHGALFFLMFFLGTTLYFIPFTFLGYFGRLRWLQSAARIAAVIVGVILFIQSW